MLLPAFTPRSEWTPPHLGSLPRWTDAKRVALDIETHDPQLKVLGPGVRRDGYITGVSFAIEDGPKAYLPVRHEGGGNLDEARVFEYLQDQAGAFKGDLVTANGSYDLDYLAEREVVYNAVRFHRDVQIAEPLCDELQFSYSLSNITKRRGIPGKDEGVLRGASAALGIDPKKDMWRLHSRFVGAYAEQDAAALLPLLRIQERQIDDEDLWEVYDLECRLLPILVKMRRRGVRLDFDQLDRIEAWSVQEEEAALNELHRLTSVRLSREDTTNGASFLPMVQQMGVKIPLTAKTKKPSLTKDFLDSLHGPIGGLINRARAFNKLRGTFINSRRAHAIGDRIHPTFVQLRSEKPGSSDDGGARYGRCASRDPNLQQEPARHPEIGPEWRKVYVPDEGGEWGCLDYSQQEPRWSVHWAEELEDRREEVWRRKYPQTPFEPTGAHLAGDRYREDPRTDSHDMMTKLIHGEDAWDAWDKDERKRNRSNAKNIYLGLCYGEGEVKLCHDVGLPTEWKPAPDWVGKYVPHLLNDEGEWEVAGSEGKALINHFHKRVPWLSDTAKTAERRAASAGFVRTILGRKCRFPKANGGRKKFDWTHKAFNRVIQGSSGDQMKKAMVLADAAGFRLQLQVHDELDLTLKSREEARELAEIMRNAVPCRVPHKVDVEVGPNWAEIRALGD